MVQVMYDLKSSAKVLQTFFCMMILTKPNK